MATVFVNQDLCFKTGRREPIKVEPKVAQIHREIVGQSQAIEEVLHQIEPVAPTDSTVLIRGETGTSKEVVAAAIRVLGSHGEGTKGKGSIEALRSRTHGGDIPKRRWQCPVE